MPDAKRDENGYSTCPPHCECDDCVASSAHWCECCDEPGATYRGDLEGYYCDGCPHSAQCKLPEPHEPRDPVAQLERSIAELGAWVAAISDDELERMGELERRLITETRAHLAEYDRAKKGKGGP